MPNGTIKGALAHRPNAVFVALCYRLTPRSLHHDVLARELSFGELCPASVQTVQERCAIEDIAPYYEEVGIAEPAAN